MKRLFLRLLLIFVGFIIQAQQVSSYSQVRSYSIDMHFFPEDAQMWGNPVANDAFMRGNSRVEFSEINSNKLVFYLHGELKIDSIISGNTLIKYKSEKVLYEEDYSIVALKTTINSSALTSDKTLDIYYSGFMNPSRAQSLSSYMHINKNDGVFLRAYGYSYWFPIFLEPDQEACKVDIKNITVNLPENFKCVINGELISETMKNGIYTTTWKPGKVDLWNVQCTAREYRVIEKNNVFVYYLDDKETGGKIIDLTEKLKDVFHTKLRTVHDTSSLYIIEMPEYGNISCQNVIGISTDVYNGFDDDLYSKRTIAHELVHPYVSIPVKKNNPFSALVVEGFPSFFYLYGLKKTLDNTVFDLENYMKLVEEGYIKRKQTGKDRRGNPLPDEKPILKITYDEIGNYKDRFVLPDRVSLFLYHIWTEMGDTNYDRFLKDLFQFDSINYNSFENLILRYLPGYESKLNIWLNTIDYPEFIQIKDW